MATRGGVTGTTRAPRGANGTAQNGHRATCCSLYHRAIELVGKRWSGAILLVLLDGPLNFTGIRELVPDISDRLLSERLKELEAEGIVERRVIDTSPPRVECALTPKGEALEPAVRALKSWAQRHLA
jgi:DNA-binding HxlR family transcriptional regulator